MMMESEAPPPHHHARFHHRLMKAFLRRPYTRCYCSGGPRCGRIAWMNRGVFPNPGLTRPSMPASIVA